MPVLQAQVDNLLAEQLVTNVVYAGPKLQK